MSVIVEERLPRRAAAGSRSNWRLYDANAGEYGPVRRGAESSFGARDWVVFDLSALVSRAAFSFGSGGQCGADSAAGRATDFVWQSLVVVGSADGVAAGTNAAAGAQALCADGRDGAEALRRLQADGVFPGGQCFGAWRGATAADGARGAGAAGVGALDHSRERVQRCAQAAGDLSPWAGSIDEPQRQADLCADRDRVYVL